MIVGFVTVLLVPLLIIYQTHIQTASDEVVSVQLRSLVNRIIDAAESVYYLGEPSQTQIKVYIPQKLDSAVVSGKSVSFNMRFGQATSEIFQTSAVNLTGTLPADQGLYTITIKALSDTVNISYS